MIMNFDIDTVIFVIYLISNVGFGLYWGKGNKTIRDYALGGRNFSTGTLVSTIMAAWIGGDYLFITLAQVYTTGLHYAIGCLGMVACLALNAYIFIPRMSEFLGNISVAEAMGNLYGKHVRTITAISGSIVTAGFMAVQFKVFGEIFKSYLGVSSEYAIFLAGFVVILYSVFGGIRSVAFTDVIQFFTFGVLIPVLSIIIWHQYTNINGFSLEAATSNPIFNYKEFLGLENPKFWSLALLFLLFSIPDLNPTMFQRVAIGRNISQVKRAFTISTVLLFIILCGMSWIAFLLFNVNPNLQPTGLVHYIIDNHAHPGLKGFILIGIVSMCMSNADAQLNAASVIITHDLCRPLNIKLRNELFLSRIIGIVLGGGAIFLASLNYDLLSLVFMTQSFYIPIIDVPLILAILGFRSTVKSVLIGMSASFISVIIWRVYFMDITGVDSILPATVVNLIFFMGSHYLLRQKGGWVAAKS
jgi:Na+/proline symporter